MSEPTNLDRPVEAWTLLPGNGLSIPMPTADGGILWGEHFGGLTKREHAAIALRIPESGDPELDAMIRKTQRRDLAARVLAGFGADPQCIDGALNASAAVDWADTLLAALDAAPEGGRTVAPDTCPYCGARRTAEGRERIYWACGTTSVGQSPECARYIRVRISQLKGMISRIRHAREIASRRMIRLHVFTIRKEFRRDRQFDRLHNACLREITRLRNLSP